MDNEFGRLTSWLLDNAGPIIRYRTAKELLDDCCRLDNKRLLSEVLELKETKRWLNNLGNDRIHGSTDTQLASY